LSEWTGAARWRERALEAGAQLLDLFWDEEAGGFFTTGRDAEALVVRPKEFSDGALPSANAVAVVALLRAGALTDDQRIDTAVERTMMLALPLLERHPLALADLVAATEMWTSRREVVITGSRPDLLAETRRRWLPTAVLAWGERDGGPLFDGRPDEPGLAYVCHGRACLTPARDAGTLSDQLDSLAR
jgi:uncharacterized protein YyaL (SSP411 family)